MLRVATIAGLMLLGACSSVLPTNTPRTPNPRPTVGIAANSTRGRCTWAIVNGQPHRVCLPRGRGEPRDSVITDPQPSDTRR